MVFYKKWLSIFMILGVILYLVSCGSQSSFIRPMWVDSPHYLDTDEKLFFTGTSRRFSSEAEARNDARNNISPQVAKYYGNFIRAQAMDISTTDIDYYDEEVLSYASSVVSRETPVEYYTEVYRKKNNQEEYVVHVLSQIPRKKAEEDIHNFAKNVSERYSNILVKQNTFAATLRMYENILTELDQNPLRREAAYYDSPNGRVGLYEYLTLQINTLVDSITLESIPSVIIQKADTKDISGSLYSNMMEHIGTIDCRVSIYRINKATPDYTFQVNADKHFSIPLSTQGLEAGMYTVQVELLMRVPQIKKNLMGNFSLEVTPIPVTLEFAGDAIGEKERAILLQSIQKGLEQDRVPLDLPTFPTQAAGAGQKHYALLVTVNYIDYRNPYIIGCYVTIAFTRNNQIVGPQAISKELKEMNTDLLFRKEVADYIRNNRQFFQGIKRAIL